MPRLFKRRIPLRAKPRFLFHRSSLRVGLYLIPIMLAGVLLATCTIKREPSLSKDRTTTPVSTTQPPESLLLLTGTPTNGTTASQAEPIPTLFIQKTLDRSRATAIISSDVPTSTVGSQISATSTPRLLATSDLLYMDNNRLLRWDHVTQYSSSIAENVVSFSTNMQGSKIALLRPSGVSANGNELFDLDLLDIASKQTRHLIEATPRLTDMSLSPDGAWLAFQQIKGDDPAIFLLMLSEPAVPIALSKCLGLEPDGCTDIVWSSDSRSLLWSDKRGVWIASAGTGSAIQLHTSLVEVPDPQGRISKLEVRFATLGWSPVGRFALLQVFPNQSEASWHAIIDTRTGRIGQVLDSYRLAPMAVNVSWLPDGYLAVARGSDLEHSSPATIQLWNVLATNPELLVSSGKYEIPSDLLSAEAVSLTTTDNEAVPLQIDWVQQISPDHIIFGAFLPSSKVLLIDLNLQTEAMDALFQLQEDIVKVLWAPDGSGVLAVTSNGKAFFVSPDGKIQTELKAADGIELSGFIWLPPSWRK